MPSPAKMEREEVTDYSCLMADGRSREFIWGKEVKLYTECCALHAVGV